MSAVGYDFGNLNSYIAVARDGGIETLTNDYSMRATPSCVAYGHTNRFMGDAARQQVNTNSRNAVMNFKHLLGRKFSDPVAQLYKKFVPCDVIELPDDGIGLKVNHLGETRILTPEQVTAAFLFKLKQITESALGAKVLESVISVPYYFSEDQRRALLAAGQIAGMHVLEAVNEHTAVGIAYGLYKGSNLPPLTEKPKLVAFVDAGHSCVQASIMAFNDRKVTVLGASHDLTVGGLFFDDLIREHFHKHILSQYKLDAQKNHRAWLRLLDESEKIKKLMSANHSPIPLNIECFMEDKDVAGKMDRALFEELAEPLFQKIRLLLQKLIGESGVKCEDISEVEIIGGTSRIPFVKQIIANFFNREPKTTMNQDEAVARGAGIRCAIASPSIKIKEFVAEDSHLFDIKPPFSPHLEEWVRVENEMQKADLTQKLKADAKNSVEEYCYGMRDKLGANFSPFVTAEEIETFQGLLAKTEEWLYGDGEDASREQYETQLADLRSTIEGPIRKREREAKKKEDEARKALEREAKLREEAERKAKGEVMEEDGAGKTDGGGAPPAAATATADGVEKMQVDSETGENGAAPK